MKIHLPSPKFCRQLALATITSACLFVSAAHAAFYAESHACKSNSATGSENGVGTYYYPATRDTLTHLIGETFSETVTLKAELWAYGEGGGPPVYHGSDTRTVPPGYTNRHAVVWYTNASNAPGHLLSVNAAWSATMMRWSGTYIDTNDPFDEHGCRTEIISF